MRKIIGAACGLLMIAAACQPTPPVETRVPPTSTLVGAFVPTRIATETATSTPTPTNTLTSTPTSTPTRTPSTTPSITPTPTDTPTQTPSVTPSPTPSRTPSDTPSPTPTLSPTPSPTSDGITRIQVNEGATPIAASVGTFTYESEITDDESRIHFLFEGEEGDIVDIQMQALSGDLDPYLLLTNASGEVIIENDDDPFGFGRDSFIREFELPQTGRYFVIATRLEQEEGDSEGEFVLTIENPGEAVAVATAEATAETGDATSLVCDQTVSETINDTQYTWRFSFEAEEGQIIGVQMVATSGDLDSIVRLLNEEGDVLEENDDDELGFGKDSYLREIEIPETATYVIEATRFQDELGTTAGNFDLTLVCDQDDA